MADLKVRDAPHLVRRGNSPGVIVNTNHQGYQAAKSAKIRAQEQEDIKAELEILRELVKGIAGGQS